MSKLKEKSEIKVSGIIGYFEAKVTSIGNGEKVGCPKEYIGRRVYVIVCRD